MNVSGRIQSLPAGAKGIRENGLTRSAKAASRPEASKQKKWSPLTLAYSRWLFPLINREGYGVKLDKGPVHSNTKEEILLYRFKFWGYLRAYNKYYLPKLTKTHLEKHVTDQMVFYFTGGMGRQTLVMIDIDCHNGETQGREFCQHLLAIFPGAYDQSSTNNRGYHIYLVLDTQGYHPKTLNKFYSALEKWLMAELGRTGLDVGEVEIKGQIQHRSEDHGGWYCGILAKIPWVRTEADLERIEKSPVWRLNDVVRKLKGRRGTICRDKDEIVNQTILVQPKACCAEGKSKDRSELDAKVLGADPEVTKAALARLTDSPVSPTSKAAGGLTARRMTAAWKFVRQEGYLPNTDELLCYIRANNFYSPPWEYNELRRRQDVDRILQKMSPRHNPSKAVKNYNDLARRLMEGHDVRYGRKKVTWQDVSIFLSIIEAAVVKAPNPDGSVPCNRIEALWPTTARRKHFRQRHDDSKVRAIREFLCACGVLAMVDDHYAARKAMRYTIGPNHPEYGKICRILNFRLSEELLYNGTGLEKYMAA